VGSVTSIDPKQDVQTFLEFLFGNEAGYVYSPTKNPDPDNPVFRQYFFLWPTGKEQLINHINTQTQSKEVYLGPALYKGKENAEKIDVRGTQVVWVEFDGVLPDTISDIPPPNIRIQSSTDGHEHWYWKLDSFVEEQSIFEELTQKLTYHLGADFCWNANRVLRPPSTRHHESGLTVTTLSWDPTPVSLDQFNRLPQVPVKLLEEKDINFVPDALTTISKYLFPDGFLELLRAKVVSKEEYERLSAEEKNKVVGQGTSRVGSNRSAALTKLAHFCAEATGPNGKGMSNAEMLGILYNADERWKKWYKKPDRKRRLLAIINHVRSKHAVTPVDQPQGDEPRLKVYTLEEFMNTEVQLEWLVEGLMHKKGLGILSGPPDVGKSQLSVRFAEKLAKGESFLKWNITRPVKTLLVSMEMPQEELKYLLTGMDMQYKSNELLAQNMLVLPLGYSIRLGNKAAQAELAAVIDEFRPEGVIFDSLGVAMADDINSEKIILDSLDFVNKVIRTGYGAFVWFIHHNRKPQPGNRSPKKLEDLFGSQYIGSSCTTGMGLWPTKPGGPIQVNCLKLRMAKHFDPFYIQRMSNLDFELSQEKIIEEGKIFPNSVPTLDDKFRI
jgi:hypothetical protein